MEQDPRQIRHYRLLTGLAAVAYLLWWEAVELLLPGSFNPFLSRLAVVAFCAAVFVASLSTEAIARRMSRWFLACACAVTLHYFYLFRWNESDVNWVVGSYILVIAVSASISAMRELAFYAAFVLLLSGALVTFNPALLRTIFLSGIATILVFAWLGLRPRLQLVARSEEATARVQSLFDAVFEGIVLHDDGTILDANEPFARMFGYSRGEVIGRHVTSFVVPASEPSVVESVRTASTAVYEATGLRKDGSTLPLEIAAKPHQVAGRTLRLTAVRDLTERKRSEKNRILYEAAQESLRIRNEFLLILSHELKTPVTNIKLQTELVRRSLARSHVPADESERLRALVKQTDRHADRLVALIRDVVDLAQLGVGGLQTAKQRLDLAELARTVVAAHSEALRQAGCDTRVESDGPVEVLADPGRMEQVVVNLLTNALKYGAGQPVVVSVRRAGQEAILAVQDHGMGIAKEDQDRIFERFERAISARHISGMGLGLFICRYIVEAHGGRIDVASELGHGARFSVVLPLPDAA